MAASENIYNNANNCWIRMAIQLQTLNSQNTWDFFSLDFEK